MKQTNNMMKLYFGSAVAFAVTYWMLIGFSSFNELFVFGFLYSAVVGFSAMYLFTK